MSDLGAGLMDVEYREGGLRRYWWLFILTVVVLPLGVLTLLLGWFNDQMVRGTLPQTVSGNDRSDELVNALSLYNVQLPNNATSIRYTVSSSAGGGSLGVTFRTNAEGLSDLLNYIDRTPQDLVSNMNPWEVTLRVTSSFYQWDLSNLSGFEGLAVPDPEVGPYRYAVLVVHEHMEEVVYFEARDL